MKSLFSNSIFRRLSIFMFLLTLSGCSDDSINQLSLLPPATQTGQGTFGCLVNGKAFVDNSGNYNCFYQYVDGTYSFGIQAENESQYVWSLAIATYEKTIAEGEVLQLKNVIPGNAYAIAGFSTVPGFGEFSETDDAFTGELTITKFDIQEQIVSATFWFDIKDPYTGETVQIREGRFDTQFGL